MICSTFYMCAAYQHDFLYIVFKRLFVVLASFAYSSCWYLYFEHCNIYIYIHMQAQLEVGRVHQVVYV